MLKKILLTIIFIIVGLAMIGVLTSKDVSREENITIEDSPSSQKTLSQADISNYCQDVSLLKKYIDTDGINIIKILDYNEQYTLIDDNTETGEKEHLLLWNGEYESTGETIRFTCQVRELNGNPELLYLGMNGIPVFDNIK